MTKPQGEMLKSLIVVFPMCFTCLCVAWPFFLTLDSVAQIICAVGISCTLLGTSFVFLALGAALSHRPMRFGFYYFATPAFFSAFAIIFYKSRHNTCSALLATHFAYCAFHAPFALCDIITHYSRKFKERHSKTKTKVTEENTEEKPDKEGSGSV